MIYFDQNSQRKNKRQLKLARNFFIQTFFLNTPLKFEARLGWVDYRQNKIYYKL